MRVDRAHHRRVEQLAAGDRHAGLDDGDRGGDRVGGARERADGGRDRLGDRPQPQRQLGDDPERALGADEQVGEVVAGARLAGARAGADDAAVGQHHLEREHVLAHRPVAHRVGPRGAGRRHAAQRRVRPGVDREERALAADALLQRRARDAGLHGGVEVLDADAQDRVHQARVERDAALDGEHLALERGAGAERDDGHAVLVARAHDGGDLVGRARERDRVGRRRRERRLVAPVQVADRVRGGQAVAQQAPSAPIACCTFPLTAPSLPARTVRSGHAARLVGPTARRDALAGRVPAPARGPDLPARRRAARRRAPRGPAARLRGRRLDALAPVVLARPHRLPAGHLPDAVQRRLRRARARARRAAGRAAGRRAGAAGGDRRPLARRAPGPRARRAPARPRLARRRHGLGPDVAVRRRRARPRGHRGRPLGRAPPEPARLHDRGLRLRVQRRLPGAVPRRRAAHEHLLQGRRHGPLVVVRRAVRRQRRDHGLARRARLEPQGLHGDRRGAPQPETKPSPARRR